MIDKDKINELKNMNTKGTLAEQLLELQEAYDIAMKEIKILRRKLYGDKTEELILA